MFTIRNINTGSQGVRIIYTAGSSGGPANTPDAKDFRSDSFRLQQLWEKSKGAPSAKEREEFLKELRKVTEQNKQKHDALVKEIDDAIQTAQITGDRDLSKLQEFKKVVEADFAEAIKRYEAEATKAREAYETYRGTVGLQAQTEAVKKIFGVNEKSPKELTEVLDGLKHVNIPSLLTLISRNTPAKITEFLSALGENYRGNMVSGRIFREFGYSADGALGGAESIAVARFLDKYTKDAEFKGKIDSLVPYAVAGLDMSIAQRDALAIKDLTPATLVAFLSDIPGDRYLYQRKGKTEVRNAIPDILSEMYKADPSKFATTIGNILGVKDPTLDSIVAELKKNPALKGKLFDALNTNAGNGIVGLRTFLLGKGAEKAEEVVRVAKEKAEAEVAKLKAIIDDKSKPEADRKNAAEILKSLDKKGGTSWLTGEIQKVAQGAFFNIGKDAMAVGAGITYEAFVKGLTVTLGAAYANDMIIPAAVIHYDVASGKIGETDTREYRANVGVGMSVSAQKLFPIAIPFVDGGLSATDKIQTLSNGRGGIDSIGVNAQWSKVGGAVSLSYMKETMSELEQSRAKLMSAVSKMSELKGTMVTEAEVKKIITDMKLTASDAYVTYWTSRVNETYRLNNVDATTSAGARSLLLMGLVNSELEKAEAEEAQNDKDAKSFKGGSIGVASIFGVTFPIAGLVWKEGKLSYPIQIVDTPTQTTRSTQAAAPTARAEALKLKFEDTYTIDPAKKILTFKVGEKPGKVDLGTLGVYNSEKGTITLNDGVTFDDVAMNPILSADKSKIDSVTLTRKEVIQSGTTSGVREGGANNLEAFSNKYRGSIYTMNRDVKFVSFNKALSQIAVGEYTAALKTLQDFAPKSAVVRGILKDLDAASDPSRLQILNTYTYGTERVINKDQVDKNAYAAARRGTIEAEKRLGANRWNQANEDVFMSAPSHTPTQLSKLIPDQSLSVSVFATPLQRKDGQAVSSTHRIDRYTGSLAVSQVIVRDQLNADQKRAIIGEHNKEIQNQVKNLNDFIQKVTNKKDTMLTPADYVAMLDTGVLDPKLAQLGMSFDKKPVFFEARAMAGGNVCMNKTEGIGYPTFRKTNVGGTAELSRPPSAGRGGIPMVDQPAFDLTGSRATYRETVTSLTGSAASSQREKDRTKAEQRTDIVTENVTVSPQNITTLPDGTRAISVVSSGGTRIDVPLTSLTRDQAIALTRGQSITLTVEVRNSITTYNVIPGNIIPRGQVDTALHLILSESFKSEIQKLVDQGYFDKK